MDSEEMLFAATGVAGYALALELLLALVELGVIDEVTFRAVIDRALANVENLNLDGEHQLSRLARMMLWAQIQD